MSERLASWHPTEVSRRGIPSPELINLYWHWGAGGWGQIQTGNIMIDGIYLESLGNAMVPPDDSFEGPRFEAFKKLAAAAKSNSSLIIAQVSHAGGQVKEWLQPNPIAPPMCA